DSLDRLYFGDALDAHDVDVVGGAVSRGAALLGVAAGIDSVHRVIRAVPAEAVHPNGAARVAHPRAYRKHIGDVAALQRKLRDLRSSDGLLLFGRDRVEQLG